MLAPYHEINHGKVTNNVKMTFDKFFYREIKHNPFVYILSMTKFVLQKQR